MARGSHHGLWEGSLYVFDDRIKIQFSEDAVTIGTCEICGEATSDYRDCAAEQCKGERCCARTVPLSVSLGALRQARHAERRPRAWSLGRSARRIADGLDSQVPHPLCTGNAQRTRATSYT